VRCPLRIVFVVWAVIVAAFSAVRRRVEDNLRAAATIFKLKWNSESPRGGN